MPGAVSSIILTAGKIYILDPVVPLPRLCQKILCLVCGPELFLDDIWIKIDDIKVLLALCYQLLISRQITFRKSLERYAKIPPVAEHFFHFVMFFFLMFY